MMSQETYIITLEPLPATDRHELAPVEVRLRQLLKIALRAFRLRCTDIRQDEREVVEQCAAQAENPGQVRPKVRRTTEKTI